jgi:hypothetical protein
MCRAHRRCRLGGRAVRIPPADGDVRYTVQHTVPPVVLSLCPVRAGDVLLPHGSIPVDERLRIVGGQDGAARIAQDHMSIVKMAEHLADDADELILIRRRDRPRAKRRPESVPVDSFVVEVGVFAVESAPQGIELGGEVGWRGRRRGGRVARAARVCRERIDRQENDEHGLFAHHRGKPHAARSMATAKHYRPCL